MNPCIPDPLNVAEIERWRCRKLSLALLKADLLPSDSHEGPEDGEPQAWMTSDQAFYFVPCPDDPVMTGPRIGHPAQPTDRHMWRIEVLKCSPGGYWDPPDCDLCEVGDRQPNLYHAIEEASRLDHENMLAGVGEGIYWEGEAHRERIQPEEDWR